MGVRRQNSIDEHVKNIKRIYNYKLIGEANYSLVDNLDEDDVIPDDIWKEPKPVSKADSNIHEDDEEESREETMGDIEQEELPNEEQPEVEEPNLDQPPTEPKLNQEQPSLEDVQNDILQHSVSAMKKMNAQLSNLELTLNNLNNQIEILSKDVEEVKEPTTVEKLEAKKEDSHPFYMNLNDMWNGNSFQARTQLNNADGIVKLDDDTYIADFDSLPKFTSQEIKDSFR